MITTRRRRTGMLLATILMGLAVGCRESDEAREDEATPDPVPAEGEVEAARLAEPGSEPAPEGSVRAELHPQGGTDVVGFAILAPRPGATAITVEIHGANSGYPYVAELIEGTCASPGAVVAVLSEMTAGEGGDAQYNRMLDRSLLAPDGPDRAVRVRGADDPIAVVACGDLGTPRPS